MIWLRDNNDGSRVYLGNIEIEGSISTFYVQTNGDGRILIESIRVDEQLAKLLENVKTKKWVHEKITKLSNVQDLPALFEEIIQTTTPRNKLRNTNQILIQNFPQVLTQNIDEIGWNHFVSINEEFTLLKLGIHDEKNRYHTIDLTLSHDYPVSPPLISLSAPFLVQLDWKSSYTLHNVLETIRGLLSNYSTYFDVLDDIDQNTIVLEPIPPVYTIPSRRIAISRSCSVRFVINPLNPYNFCEEIVFLGPLEETSRLRQNMSQRISKWDNSQSIRLNLELILDIQFPSPREQQTVDEISNECGVCYSYQLHSTSSDGISMFPDQVCANPKCGRVFHYDCLITWLQSVPTNKSSFGTIFGSCPYCQEPISAKSFK